MASIDYGKILKRSIELTRRNRWLWVYGLTLAVFGGGSGGNGGGGGGSSSTPELPKEIPNDLPEKTSFVLGQATSVIKDWFTTIPLSTWILIAGAIFIVVLLALIISWIIHSWAKGALIAGLDDADHENEVTLQSTSSKGIAKIKHLIILGLISAGIIFMMVFLVIVAILIGTILLKSQPGVRTVWFVVWIVALVFTGIIAIVLFTMLSIYAERLIVLKNHTPWQAWKKGLSLSKKHFIPTFIMGIINSSVGCTVGCLSTLVLLVILGIPAIILVLPYFKDGFKIPDWPVLVALGILVLLFIYLNHAVTAVLTVFRFSNWNLLFKELVSEEEKHA